MTNENIVNKVQQAAGQERAALLEQLYAQNTGLIGKAAQKYAGFEDRQDLKQICCIALIEAADSYRADADTAFSTFAYRCMIQRMQRHIDGKTGLPEYRAARVRAYRQAAARISAESGTDATDAVICGVLGCTVAELQAIKADANSSRVLSIEDQTADGLTIADTLPDSRNSINVYIETRAAAELWEQIAKCCNQTEQQLLCECFQHGRTVKQAAALIGQPEQATRRLLNRCLKRLSRKVVIMRHAESLAYRGSGRRFAETWDSSTETAALYLYSAESSMQFDNA